MIEAPTAIAESNRHTIRQAFDAWHDGTGTIADVLAPDVVWRIEGHSLASKTYSNKHQLIDELLAPFGARFNSSDPFRPITIRSVHADGDTVIVVWDGRGTTRDGQTYENSYAWIMRMRDSKVIDATAFYDTMSFNDVWTRVQPNSRENQPAPSSSRPRNAQNMRINAEPVGGSCAAGDSATDGHVRLDDR